MPKFRRIVLSMLCLLPLAGGAAVLAWIDGADLRPYLHGALDRLSAAVGCRISVSDYLRIDVSLNPTLRIGGLTVANAPWGKADYALRVDKADLQISLPEMLRGEFALRRLVVEAAQASIELDENGALNWRVKDLEAAKRVLSPIIMLVRGADVVASSVDVRASNVAIEYYDHTLSRVRTLEVETASLLRQQRGEALNASLVGRLAGEALRLTGYISAPRSANQHDVMAMADGLHGVVLAEGVVVDRGGVADVDANLHAALSGLGRVNEIFDTNLPTLAPVTLSAHFLRDSNRLSLTDINALVGTAQLSGELRLDYGGARPAFDADLIARNVDTAQFHLPAAGSEPNTEKTKAVLDRSFSVAWLDNFDLKGRLRLEGARIEKVPVTNADAQLALKSGRLEVIKLAVKSPAGSVALAGTLDNVTTMPTLRGRLSGGGVPSRLVNAGANADLAIDGKVGFETSGNSLRKLIDQGRIAADLALKSNFQSESLRFELAPAARLQGRADLTHALNATAMIAGTEYMFDADVAAPSSLLEPHNNYAVRVSTRRGMARLNLDGNVSDLMNQFKLDFAVNGDVAPTEPTASDLWLPARASGRLKGSLKAGEIAFSKGVLEFPSGEGSVEFALKWKGKKPRLTGSIGIKRAGRLDSKLARPAGQLSPQERPDLGWLDTPLALGWLQSIDADVALQAEHVAIALVSVEEARGAITLADGKLTAQLDASMKEGVVNVRSDMNGGATPSLQVNLQSKSLDVSQLWNGTAESARPKSRLAGNITWLGHGSTLYELLDEVSGQVRLSRESDGDESVVAGTFKASQRGVNKDRTLTVDGDFRVHGRDLAVALATVDLRQLLTSLEPVPVRIDLGGEQLRAGIAGEVANVAVAPMVDLTLWIDAASLELLRPILHDGAVKLAPLTLRAGVSLDQSRASPTMEVNDLKISAGPGQIDGWLRLVAKAGRPRVDGALSLRDLDLSWEVPQKAPPAVAQPNVPAHGRMFSSARFDHAPLRRYDGNLVLSTKNIRVPGRVLDGFATNVSVDRGLIKIELLHSEAVSDTAAHVSIRLDARTDVTLLDLSVRSSSLDLRTLLSRSSLAGLVSGNMVVDVALTGSGASMSAMMASLNGEIKLSLENGTAKAKALDRVVGGVRAVMGQVFAKKSEESKINCALCDLKVESGVVSTRLALVDTEYSLLLAQGTVDLGQEQLKLKFTPQAKGVTLSMASPVRLSGSLSDPHLNIDTKGAINKVVELLAVIAYPPVLIVGLEDLVISKDNPCLTMVQPNRKGPIRRFIQGLKSETPKATASPQDDGGR